MARPPRGSIQALLRPVWISAWFCWVPPKEQSPTNLFPLNIQPRESQQLFNLSAYVCKHLRPQRQTGGLRPERFVPLVHFMVLAPYCSILQVVLPSTTTVCGQQWMATCLAVALKPYMIIYGTVCSTLLYLLIVLPFIAALKFVECCKCQSCFSFYIFHTSSSSVWL